MSKHRYVYFVEGAGKIKIGSSKQPAKRLLHIQSGSPVLLSLLALIPAGPDDESELHVRFARHRSHGEWFYPGVELLDYIEALPVPLPWRDRSKTIHQQFAEIKLQSGLAVLDGSRYRSRQKSCL